MHVTHQQYKNSFAKSTMILSLSCKQSCIIKNKSCQCIAAHVHHFLCYEIYGAPKHSICEQITHYEIIWINCIKTTSTSKTWLQLDSKESKSILNASSHYLLHISPLLSLLPVLSNKKRAAKMFDLFISPIIRLLCYTFYFIINYLFIIDTFGTSYKIL